MRPQTLEDYIGQKHLVGTNGIIRRMIEAGNVASFILWGPPGVGKTTLAHIVSTATGSTFHTLSAVTSGVKEVREVIERAQKEATSLFAKGRPILFIDEIHRFSKSQQDSLLGAVEKGIVTLIGATTENPSFEVIRPLLSRTQVYTLKPLDDTELQLLLDRCLSRDSVLKERTVKVEQTSALFHFSGGDARKLLNTVELLEQSTPCGHPIVINDKTVIEHLQENPAAYDKDGEMHYDIISAFIKSIRGSDPDAAVYWLARMIAGGEDPEFIARRMTILACEDIGLANPNAMLIAETTYEIIRKIGMPEGRIPLSECAIYLANSAKSNTAYLAIDAALAEVNNSGDLPVPLHIRNAPTGLMKKLGYGADYKYAHDYPGNFVLQQFLPDKLVGTHFWHPGANPHEQTMRNTYKSRWGTDPENQKPS